MLISEFPFSSLPPVVQEAVSYSSSRHALGHHAYALAALTILGGAAGRSFATVEIHIGKATFPNLLSIVVGDTGSGKGALSRLIEPVYNYQLDWAASREIEIRKAQSKLRILRTQRTALERTLKTSAEVDASTDLSAILAEIGKLELLARAKPKLVVDQATSAGLCTALRGYDDCLMFTTLDGIDALSDAAFGKDPLQRKLILSGFANEFVDRTTAASMDYNGRPCLAGLYATQPSELSRLLIKEPRRSAAIKIGLLNRILVAESFIRASGHRTIDNSDLTGWERFVIQLLKKRQSSSPIRYTWSEEASDAFNEVVYRWQQSKEFRTLGTNELTARDRELLVKIATIFLRCVHDYEALASPVPLDDVSVAKAAGEVWLYLSRHRLRAFCAPQLAQLEELRESLTKLLEGISEHEIYTSQLKGTVRHVRREDLEDMLRICPGLVYLRHGRIGAATRGPEGEILGLKRREVESVTL